MEELVIKVNDQLENRIDVNIQAIASGSFVDVPEDK